MSKTVVEFLERPRMVLGATPCGESPLGAKPMDDLVRRANKRIFGRILRKCRLYCIVGAVVGCVAYRFIGELGVFLFGFSLGCFAALGAMPRAAERLTIRCQYQLVDERIVVRYEKTVIGVNKDSPVVGWLDPQKAENPCFILVPPLACELIENDMCERESVSSGDSRRET